jgi:hypothetical protein
MSWVPWDWKVPVITVMAKTSSNLVVSQSTKTMPLRHLEFTSTVCLGHIWVHWRQPPPCVQCGGVHRHRDSPQKQHPNSVPPCCNCNLEEGELTRTSHYSGCSHAKQELQSRKNRGLLTRGNQGEHTPNTQHPITCSLLLYATPKASIRSNHHNTNIRSLQGTHRLQVKSQTSCQSVQANNVNTNAMHDTIVVITTV